jgi:hypothetical protein
MRKNAPILLQNYTGGRERSSAPAYVRRVQHSLRQRTSTFASSIHSVDRYYTVMLIAALAIASVSYRRLCAVLELGRIETLHVTYRSNGAFLLAARRRAAVTAARGYVLSAGCKAHAPLSLAGPLVVQQFAKHMLSWDGTTPAVIWAMLAAL